MYIVGSFFRNGKSSLMFYLAKVSTQRKAKEEEEWRREKKQNKNEEWLMSIIFRH